MKQHQTTPQPSTNTEGHEGKRKNELEALNNALKSFNLKGYDVFGSHTRKYQYCLLDDKATYLTGFWNYEQLNHFIMGYGKASKKAKAENKTLKAANRELLEALRELAYVTGHAYDGKPALVKAQVLISKHSKQTT